MNDDSNMQPVIYQSPPNGPLQELLLRLRGLSRRAKLTIFVLILLIAGGGAGLYLTHQTTQTSSVTANTKQAAPSHKSTQTISKKAVTSFAECKAAAGSTLSTTTPPTCTTSDGQKFTDTSVAAPTPKTTKTPTTTKTTPPPTGSSGGTTTSGLNCSNPIFTTSWPQTQYGGWQDSSGNRVNANVLTGSGGSKSQVLNVCSLTNWNVVANFPDNGGSINTYPDTQYDLVSDKTISQYTSLTTCFGSKPPTPSGPQWPTPGGSEWDYAYDVWINHTSGENIWSNDIEIMVWNDWTDTIYPPAVGTVGSGGSRAVTIDGIAYHMFQGGGGNEWIYTRDVKTTSGCFDMLSIMKDLVANNSAAAGITLASAPQHIEYGVEIAGTYGTQTFQITNASLTVK